MTGTFTSQETICDFLKIMSHLRPQKELARGERLRRRLTPTGKVIAKHRHGQELLPVALQLVSQDLRHVTQP